MRLFHLFMNTRRYPSSSGHIVIGLEKQLRRHRVDLPLLKAETLVASHFNERIRIRMAATERRDGKFQHVLHIDPLLIQPAEGSEIGTIESLLFHK